MSSFPEEEALYSITDIQNILPHRYPFLLIDKVVKRKEVEKEKVRIGSQVWAIKNVTINEPFFQGHFPEKPIMPGVLLLESMAQTGAFACLKKEEKFKNLFIVGVNSARFRRPVLPGHQLHINALVTKQKKTIFVIQCQIHCNEQLMAEAEIRAHVEFY